MADLDLLLDTSDRDFRTRFEHLIDRAALGDSELEEVVAGIVRDVAERGDEAVLDWTNRLDRLEAASVGELTVLPEEFARAGERIGEDLRTALAASADRIRSFHERQREESWRYVDEYGTELGQRVTPIERVGIYVPGGQASYPSSLLMCAVPAQVAGVGEITAVVPSRAGALSDAVLAAAHLCNVDRLYKIGGAQAVAALALGTRSIRAVDKIVGPGNAYVATAKRLLYGRVGIDMIAGPSEVVIVADGSADPEWLVQDLFAQAEHDSDAQSILISPERGLLETVARLVAERLETAVRRETILASLASNGALIRVQDFAEALDLVNEIAPEHLELAVADPEALLDGVRHAGAIFLGSRSAEVLGDYSAGPSHVLPTAGTARFSSPLGVYDFQKRSSLIKCSPRGALELARTAAVVAREEGLDAHRQAAEQRITNR